MSVKFLSFRPDPSRPMHLQDKTKWQPSSDGRTYKLIAPDLEADRQFAYAEVKVVKGLNQGERLSISGVANANIIDRMQERLDPTGIDITSYMKNSILLAHHSYYHPIGQVDSIDVQDDGVHFTGWIGDPGKSELTPMQKEIRSLVAQGILKTVSVGFIPKKVRAPLFDDVGNVTEPCVIESWELLELSVVAVPCNQDSLFQVRGIDSDTKSVKLVTEQARQESLNESTVVCGLESILEENKVVQTLIFDKDIFTLEHAKDWAQNHAFSSEAVEETDTSYCLLQFSDKELDADSVREVNITEGVNAVVGKLKNAEVSQPAAGDSSDSSQQMLSLLQQLNEGQKRVVEMCDLMLKKLEAKSMDEDEDEKPAAEEKPVDDDQDEERHDKAKALDARLAKLEKGFDKLVNSVSLLIQNINK